MSVINNVLKELETRESRFTPIEIDPAQTPSLRRRDTRPWLFAALALSVLAATYFLWHSQARFGMDSTATVAEMKPVSAVPAESETRAAVVVEAGLSKQNEAEPAEPVAAATTIPASPAPTQFASLEPVVENLSVAEAELVTEALAPANQIIGLQLRESETEMQMEFVLRDKTVAYLRERGENHFSYRLGEIESRITAPIIRDNRWVRQLSITTAGDGVDIGFETAPGILVETAQSLGDGEAVWVISLRQAAPAEPEPALAVQAGSSEAARAAAPALSDQAENDIAENVEATSPAEATALVQQPSEQSAPQPVKLEIKTTTPNAKALNQLEYAVELINSRRLAEAEKTLRGLFDGSEDYRARVGLIALYDLDRRHDRMLQLAQESMQRYPERRLFRTEYARALFQAGAYSEAIALLADVETPDATQLALLAASHQRIDEHVDAVRHYRLALKLDAGNARNWVGLGISQEHTADLEDALNSYRKAGRLGSLNDRLQAFVKQRSDTLKQVLN